MLPRVGAALSQFIAPLVSSSSQKQPQQRQGQQPGQQKKQSSQQSPEPLPEQTPKQLGQTPRQPRDHTEGVGDFVRFQPAKAKPELQLIEGGAGDSPQDTAAPPPPAAPPTAQTASGPSVAAVFLQLFQSLHSRRMTLTRWLGGGAYQAAAENQKRGKRFRKGTILDGKAE